MPQRIVWPDGKDFAFTIFDDPDCDTVENVAALYSFIGDLGLRTTKAVWPIKGNCTPRIGGTTCEDQPYLRWMQDLQDDGFEIALHNVTYHTSVREETRRGLETFRRLFNHYPNSFANHTGCYEGIYWGRARLSGIQRVIYDLLHLRPNGQSQTFEGHIETSPLFWGDLCKDNIRYVRNFTLDDINTLKACPVMPYHDVLRPYVNYWFAASEGRGVDSFTETLCESNQDRLALEGGACIMYTHLASGFFVNGELNSRFKFLLERISRMNGWFVPVRTLLDYVRQVRGSHVITTAERNALERRWLWHKIFHTNGRS